jgi:4-hydroxy-3-methylbut-2-enyl diphosphate reductase IspH
MSARAIRYRSVSSKSEVVGEGWLPAEGSVSIGLTSGASTPDNLVEVVVRKLVDYAHTLS